MRVPFLDLTPRGEERDELSAAVARVVASGRYLLGPELDAFEHEFARFAGARHCVAVGSGLDALRLALQARGIGRGDEVIVPGQTFIATWLAVSAAGAVPVPVDVEPDSHLLDVDAAAAHVGPRTAAIVPVDLYGQPADHRALRALADRHGLWLLDDAAQAHGATVDGRPVAAFADAAAWSFYPGKNLGALGDGGAVTTDDEALARRIRRLRNYGSEQKYVHLEAGVNSRLDEIQAAVLRVKLSRFGVALAHRRETARRYSAALADGPLGLPPEIAGTEPSRHLYVVRSAARDELQSQLAQAGVETLIHYPIPPHRQEAYAGTLAASAHLPNAERAAAEILSLPIGPHMTTPAVDHVARAVSRAAECLQLRPVAAGTR
jgi:dTDP-3-amino-3,4,6-trideoxy-alpha-D-glucose transaminase